MLWLCPRRQWTHGHKLSSLPRCECASSGQLSTDFGPYHPAQPQYKPTSSWCDLRALRFLDAIESNKSFQPRELRPHPPCQSKIEAWGCEAQSYRLLPHQSYFEHGRCLLVLWNRPVRRVPRYHVLPAISAAIQITKDQARTSLRPHLASPPMSSDTQEMYRQPRKVDHSYPLCSLQRQLGGSNLSV